MYSYFWSKPYFVFYSGDETETDSEVEDRVDGVKSWLSKNKGSAKTQSDEGSLKSTRSVITSMLLYVRHHVLYMPVVTY